MNIIAFVFHCENSPTDMLLKDLLFLERERAEIQGLINGRTAVSNRQIARLASVVFQKSIVSEILKERILKIKGVEQVVQARDSDSELTYEQVCKKVVTKQLLLERDFLSQWVGRLQVEVFQLYVAGDYRKAEERGKFLDGLLGQLLTIFKELDARGVVPDSEAED